MIFNFSIEERKLLSRYLPVVFKAVNDLPSTTDESRLNYRRWQKNVLPQVSENSQQSRLKLHEALTIKRLCQKAVDLAKEEEVRSQYARVIQTIDDRISLKSHTR